MLYEKTVVSVFFTLFLMIGLTACGSKAPETIASTHGAPETESATETAAKTETASGTLPEGLQETDLALPVADHEDWSLPEPLPSPKAMVPFRR